MYSSLMLQHKKKKHALHHLPVPSFTRVGPPALLSYTCELRSPYADSSSFRHVTSRHVPFLFLRCLSASDENQIRSPLYLIGSGCGQMRSPVIGLHRILFLGIGGEKDATAACRSLMANRPAARFALFPLALLLVLAAASTPIAAAKAVIKDDVSCTMCSSCDNPCQPAASPPPPPPPPPPSTSAECPPPPSNPGAISYYSPPPPYGYSSPPPPSSSGGGGLYYYPPPSNGYYPAPPPPNPFLPYFPFYYYSPPPSKYHSGSLSRKPLSSIPLLLLLLHLFL